MVEHLINLLVITVGQYGQFGGEEYERQFERYLLLLQKATGKNQEEAIQFLIDVVEGRAEAA